MTLHIYDIIVVPLRMECIGQKIKDKYENPRVEIYEPETHRSLDVHNNVIRELQSSEKLSVVIPVKFIESSELRDFPEYKVKIRMEDTEFSETVYYDFPDHIGRFDAKEDVIKIDIPQPKELNKEYRIFGEVEVSLTETKWSKNTEIEVPEKQIKKSEFLINVFYGRYNHERGDILLTYKGQNYGVFYIYTIDYAADKYFEEELAKKERYEKYAWVLGKASTGGGMV